MGAYCFKEGQIWDIEMKGLGRLANHWLKGNQKVIEVRKPGHIFMGHNTKFEGSFGIKQNRKGRWKLNYWLYTNSWFVQKIWDTVEFKSADEADGVFHWWKFRVCKFEMKCVVSQEVVTR